MRGTVIADQVGMMTMAVLILIDYLIARKMRTPS